MEDSKETHDEQKDMVILSTKCEKYRERLQNAGFEVVMVNPKWMPEGAQAFFVDNEWLMEQGTRILKMAINSYTRSANERMESHVRYERPGTI